MALDMTVARMAIKLSAKYAEDYAWYLRTCEDYRRRGYRPHHCEHGANRWTDYDNICGPCEDGETMADPMFRRNYALGVAKIRVREATELLDLLSTAQRLGVVDAVDRDMLSARFRELMTVA